MYTIYDIDYINGLWIENASESDPLFYQLPTLKLENTFSNVGISDKTNIGNLLSNVGVTGETQCWCYW